MKILILILFPFVVSSQTLTDSTIIPLPSGSVIRYATSYGSVSYNSGLDSILFKGTVSKRRGVVSAFDLPIATATQAALNAKQNTITVLPFANGGVSGAAAAPATTGAMTVSMTSSVITITPTGACTFNASGGVAGQKITFAITTSGTTSFVLTFGTNFRKVGTLTTGTTSARFFSVTFICINGTIWQEIGRTAAQT